MRRVLTLILSMGLLGLVPVALTASPAEAATYQTRVVQTNGFDKRYVHGERIYFNFRAEAYNPSAGAWQTAPVGTVKVQRRKKGESSWRTVKTNDNAWIYDSGRWQGKASYRVVYTGGTYYGDTFPRRVWTMGTSISRTWVTGFYQMKVNDPWSNGKADAKVKVKPYKRKVVKLQRKRGGNWRTVRKDRTNRKGVAVFRNIAAPGRYRTLAKSTKRYEATKVKFRTYRY